MIAGQAEVLTQASATTSLHQVALGLFDDHFLKASLPLSPCRSDANRKVSKATAAVEWLLKR